jgi:predicted nucleotidyltransferase
MDSRTALSLDEAALRRFADRLRDRIGAQRVLLFGSHALGRATDESDYDFVVVADRFDSAPLLDRQNGLRELFYETVGLAPLDFVCLSPREFERASEGASLIAEILPGAIDLLAERVEVAG